MMARPNLRWTWLLLLLLPVVRTLALMLAVPAHRPLGGDEPIFDALARSLASGQGLVYHGRPWVARAPGWVFVLAAIRMTLGDSVRAAAGVQGLFDCGSMFLAAWTAATIFGSQRAGILAFVLVGLWPPYLREARFLQTEPLFTLCVAATTAMLVAWCARPSVIRSIALGLVAGGLSLVRPNGLAVFGALLAGALVTIHGLARRGVALALVLLALGAALTPWAVRNWREFHRFVLVSSGTGELFYMGTTPETDGRWDHRQWAVLQGGVLARERARLGRNPDPIEADHALLLAGIENWRRDPWREARIAVKRVARLVMVPLSTSQPALRFGFLIVILIVHGLAIYGTLHGLRIGGWTGGIALAILACVVLNAAALSVFYTNSRYFEPLRWLELILGSGGALPFASVVSRRFGAAGSST